MASRREERMPPTGAGLIRYFQEEGTGMKISPRAVLVFTGAIIVFVLMLHIAGSGVLGF
jgi:preprotein translocase subunit Sec61beta